MRLRIADAIVLVRMIVTIHMTVATFVDGDAEGVRAGPLVVQTIVLDVHAPKSIHVETMTLLLVDQTKAGASSRIAGVEADPTDRYLLVDQRHANFLRQTVVAVSCRIHGPSTGGFRFQFHHGVLRKRLITVRKNTRGDGIVRRCRPSIVQFPAARVVQKRACQQRVAVRRFVRRRFQVLLNHLQLLGLENDVECHGADSQQRYYQNQEEDERSGASGSLDGTRQMHGPTVTMFPKSGRMRGWFSTDASSQVDAILGGRSLASQRQGIGPLIFCHRYRIIRRLTLLPADSSIAKRFIYFPISSAKLVSRSKQGRGRMTIRR